MKTLLFRFAGAERWGWAAVFAPSLVALSGCSKSEEGKPEPSAASQAQAAQSAIAAAQAANDQHRAMPMQDAAGAAGAAGTDNGPPTNRDDPTANMGRKRLLGQPSAMNAAGGLPAARGAPHIYHVGADGFFLEHASAIGLTPEQQSKLSAIKEKAELAYAATQQKIDEAENDVWTLTSAEKPDATKIDARISEIGRLGARQRMDYVRAIGSAVAVLNAAQHKAVIALGPPSGSPAAPSSSMKMGTTPPAAGMPMDAGGAMPGMGMEDDMPMAPKAPMAPMGGTPEGGPSRGMGHM